MLHRGVIGLLYGADRVVHFSVSRAWRYPVPKSGKTIQQVAALPFVAGESGYKLVLIASRNDGRWLIPKGWPEDGEKLEAGAAREAREAREEAGIVGDIHADPVGSYVYMKLLASGERIRSEVSVFPLVVCRLQSNWPERASRERRRVGDKDIARLLRELNGKRSDVLDAAHAALKF